jgi:putative ABC transport system permease protein
VGFSLALLTVLNGYLAMQNAWSDAAKTTNRIVVMNIQGFSGLLPISYVDEVRTTKGVKDAVPYAWFGGEYGTERMPFAQFATDPEHVFNVWDEFKIDPAQLKEWCSDRQGCVADRKLAEKWKWKVGDQILIKGTYYPFNLDLKLVGTFDAPELTDSLWFNWKLLDEQLQSQGNRGSGNAGIIYAKGESASAVTEAIRAIDEEFSSSQNPTRTQTEAAFAQMFADMVGNIRMFILVIGLAVVFSLTLVTATAMAMSMRERTTEVAVLKAIGFPRSRVLRMVLGEASLISLFGGVLGVGLGSLFIQGLHTVSSQMFPLGIVAIMGPWMLMLLAVSAGIGFVSGIVPAIRAAQLSVIDGLRRVV